MTYPGLLHGIVGDIEMCAPFTSFRVIAQYLKSEIERLNTDTQRNTTLLLLVWNTFSG